MIDFLVGNNFIAAILAFALVLIPAIIIHELGHFLAAKAVGITVLEFGIGFPPRLLRLFNWGETEFTLNLLPLGGFVRPLGEDLVAPLHGEAAQQQREEFLSRKSKNDNGMSERDELRARGVSDKNMMTVNEADPWSRIFFMSAGALANFVSAILLFILIALIGIPQFIGARLQVINIPEGSQLARAGVAEGDAIEQINGEVFADKGEFFREIQQLALEEARFTMLRSQSGENYDITVPASLLQSNVGVLITAVEENSPGHHGGFEAGDLIVRINGSELADFADPISEVQEATERSAGQSLMFTVLRDGKTLDVEVVPRVNTAPNQGRIGIGIRAQYLSRDGSSLIETTPQQALIPLPLSQAAQYGVNSFLDILRLIISIPAQLIQGTITPEQARPVSIIGISQFGGQLIKESVQQNSPVVILNFIGTVSVFLGITNLLPIPALDGGRILFVLIEIIRGKPVPPELEGRVHLIGIIILLSIGVLVMLYDVINPITLQ